MKKVVFISMIACQVLLSQEKTNRDVFFFRYLQYLDHRKEPGVSALFSLAIPGGGHFYNGNILKGIIFFLGKAGCATGLFTTANESEDVTFRFYYISGLILFSILDPIFAARDANKMNMKLRQKYKINLIGSFNRIGISFHL